MVTINQIIVELLYPIFDVLAVVVRGLGGLGIAFVAGRVLRFTIVHKFKLRFYVPLIFMGTVALFGVAGYARWSSPGTLAMVGVGVFLGYMLRGRDATQEAAGDAQFDDYYDEDADAEA